ncbi:Spo0E family sporulation regulatory protein-aspartic acid phosphatase [Acetivibrio clariflavus]|nr:Spo0E family sporulation regulatory protein-aspartic acid phosphatase [Acetivibrio clariflavus]
MKIQELQYELNSMIDNDDDYSKIYKTSVELDLLIVEYYNEVLKNKSHRQKIFRHFSK